MIIHYSPPLSPSPSAPAATKRRSALAIASSSFVVGFLLGALVMMFVAEYKQSFAAAAAGDTDQATAVNELLYGDSSNNDSEIVKDINSSTSATVSIQVSTTKSTSALHDRGNSIITDNESMHNTISDKFSVLEQVNHDRTSFTYVHFDKFLYFS